MSKATLVFGGLGGGPADANRAKFSDDEPSSQPPPESLQFDTASGHWEFPSRAVDWDVAGPMDETQTAAVPRESVYSVTYERETPTLDSGDTVDIYATLAYEALAGQYSSISRADHEFLEPPRYDDDTNHWRVAFSPIPEDEDDERLVYEKQIPKERVCYVRGTDEA
ncbi:hypothetical protein [Halorussus halophilus]|uniref:hypothetical protein n=1 Tax=Halorussus halophilus TaxID=2650975 RepID=UPI001300DAB8|nr:hypothetical protein [Halorussus halophilus]